ncbi:MAG: exodeoxyribonuclease VII large subunit [Deltaproteobacteria bacterium]|nr:MAG: exodeoxyribonuclease VII large subunit [Deltaproteobacteria bacterium]
MESNDTTSFEVDQFSERRIYSVSELTREIRGLLEDHFPFIWVEGEISNFRVPASGHYYFVLKDAQSQVRCVMFRSQQRWMRFEPEDGLHVLCQARVTVYEPRGEYQLLVDAMEPRGIGALQLAYEQLKHRLDAEGLFDPEHKKPIPFLTQRLGVVTSATGAAIRDIIRLVRRRYSNLEIYLYPVRVQGEGAAEEIAEGIETFNAEFPVDALIVGRGGGSWEDLWAFNEERVVRAIFASRIPVISAVGHEIDTTLADLVADVRAPTPSAAAELVAQHKEALEGHLDDSYQRLQGRARQTLTLAGERLLNTRQRLRHPAARLADLRLRLDEHTQRLELGSRRALSAERQRFLRVGDQLLHLSPERRVGDFRVSLNRCSRDLGLFTRQTLKKKRQNLERVFVQLDGLSPLSILARGYSITTTLPEGEVVRAARQVGKDDTVRVRLYEGSLHCKVTKVQKTN